LTIPFTAHSHLIVGDNQLFAFVQLQFFHLHRVTLIQVTGVLAKTVKLNVIYSICLLMSEEVKNATIKSENVD